MAIELQPIATVRVARGPIVLDPLVLTARSIFTGDSGEFVVRLDKRTGKKLWQKGKQPWLRSAHGDSLLVYDDETETTQLWNEDGKVLWKRPGDEEAEGDRIYFNSDGRLEVVDVLTGRTIDEFECPSGPTRFFHDGVLLLSNPDLTTDPITAVHIARRTILWRDSLIPKIRQKYGDPCDRGLSFVASLPGHAVAKTSAHLVEASLADGSLGWGLPISVPHIAPLAWDGRLYVWSARHTAEKRIVIMDAATEAVVVRSAPPARDAAESRLVIVDEATGAVVVDRLLSPYGPPFQREQRVYGGTICRHHVVFTSSSGLMAVFRLTDGELVWHHEYPAEFFSPVFEDNRLYITTADGDLVIFEARGGEL